MNLRTDGWQRMDSNTITINGIEYHRVVHCHTAEKLIRTRSAGVHLGAVQSRDGIEVMLAPGSVRIWRWRGANTLNELARNGCDSAEESDYSRVSEPAPGSVLLTEAIEVIDVTEQASKRIRSAGWAK